METRNVKITIQQAANWYSSNNDILKALALNAFSRDEIILYYVKAQSKTVSLNQFILILVKPLEVMILMMENILLKKRTLIK